MLFRSYVTAESIDGLSTSGVKIWQAARATSAASTFFDPIKIGSQEFVDGATGRNNPVESVLAEASAIWPDARSRIQCLVSIGTGKSEFRDFGDNLAEIKRTLVALATETEDTEQRVYRNQESLGVDGRYFRFNVDRGLEGVVLDEYEKQGTIVAATEAYLETPRIGHLILEFTGARAPSYGACCVFPSFNSTPTRWPATPCLPGEWRGAGSVMCLSSTQVGNWYRSAYPLTTAQWHNTGTATDHDVEKYLTWLPYLDPQGDHNTARLLRTDSSTGEWFLSGEFRQWKAEDRSFMWLHGRGQCGAANPFAPTPEYPSPDMTR